MFFPGFLMALIMGLLVAAIFSAFLGDRRPWGGGFLWLFLIIFFGAWAVGSWTVPVGPSWIGVSWIPFLVAALAIGLLLASLAEPAPRPVTTQSEMEAEAAATVGFFFWLLLLVLIAVVIAGVIEW